MALRVAKSTQCKEALPAGRISEARSCCSAMRAPHNPERVVLSVLSSHSPELGLLGAQRAFFPGKEVPEFMPKVSAKSRVCRTI